MKVHVELPDDLKDRFYKECRKLDRSMNYMIKRLIEQFVTSKEGGKNGK